MNVIVVDTPDIREQLLKDMRQQEHEQRMHVLIQLQEIMNSIGKRCVIHLEDMSESHDDRVAIYFTGGGKKMVNIECDSIVAMLMDVLQAFK